jgi:acyl carrier protein
VSTHPAPSPTDDPVLREALKRCSPATYYAACKFRASGDAADLQAVVVGVVERFVDRETRPKLDAPAEVRDALLLRHDLGLDSLTMMEIVMMAEDALGVTISNDELTKLTTFGEVHAFMAQKVGAHREQPERAESPVEAWNFAAVTAHLREAERQAATRPLTEQQPKHA